MNPKQITMGAVVIGLVAAGLIWWFYQSIPTGLETQQSVSAIQSIDKNLLSRPTTKDILGRNLNGNVPIAVNTAVLGRDDPFSDY